MISLRRWSDYVWAAYVEDGNPFGGRLLCVLDVREYLTPQEIRDGMAAWIEHRFVGESKAPEGSATNTQPSDLTPPTTPERPAVTVAAHPCACATPGAVS